MPDLAFADPEHLGGADWAHALSSGAAIFHGDGLGILDFPLSAALNTVGLHSFLLFIGFLAEAYHIANRRSIGFSWKIQQISRNGRMPLARFYPGLQRRRNYKTGEIRIHLLLKCIR
jgi:hypothetical protein